MQRHADALCGFPAQPKLGTLDSNTGPNRVRKVSKLCMHERLEIDPLPFVLYEEVEIDRERLNPLRELVQKVARTCRCGLAGNRQDHAEHIFSPMVDLEHQQAHLLF